MGFRDLGKGTLEHWQLLSRQLYTEYPLALLTQARAPEGQAASSVAAQEGEWFPVPHEAHYRTSVTYFLVASVGWWETQEVLRTLSTSALCVYCFLQCGGDLFQSWDAYGIGTTSFPSRQSPTPVSLRPTCLHPGVGRVAGFYTPFTLLCSCGSLSCILPFLLTPVSSRVPILGYCQQEEVW